MNLSPAVRHPDDRAAPHGVEGVVGSGSVRVPSVVLPIRRGAAAFLVLGLAVSACGGSTASAAPSTGSGGGSSASAAPTAAAATATATASSPAATDAAPSESASPATGGNGGTGNGSIPTLSDGQWTGGKAHAEVTGDVSGTFDAVINPALATSAGNNTSLTYFTPDSLKQVAVALAGGTAAVSVITPEWVGGGGTTEGAQCSVSFTKSEDKSLAGTVTCTNAPVIDATGAASKAANIVVTFDATR
jgi:hypothetical protein